MLDYGALPLPHPAAPQSFLGLAVLESYLTCIFSLLSHQCRTILTCHVAAGKSTLLNALVGSTLLPSTNVPETARICRILHDSLSAAPELTYQTQSGAKTASGATEICESPLTAVFTYLQGPNASSLLSCLPLARTSSHRTSNVQTRPCEPCPRTCVHGTTSTHWQTSSPCSCAQA